MKHILFKTLYRCKINARKPIKLSHEHNEFRWFSAKEAKKFLLTKYPKSFVEKLDEL